MSDANSPEPLEAAPAAAPLGPGLARRLVSMLYEALIVTAIVLIAGVAFLPIRFDVADSPVWSLLQFAWSAGAVFAYFGWFWTHGGQTLPMRVWRLRVVDRSGAPLGWSLAARRYGYAWLSLLAGGAGILWALFDRDGLFLHDRLAGTRLVLLPVEARPR
jgi:uncharacterized RDD family membrane protein YckC